MSLSSRVNDLAQRTGELLKLRQPLNSTLTAISGRGIGAVLSTDLLDRQAGDTRYAALAHNQAWSTITSTPTTVAGYGITNAALNTILITAGDGMTGGGTLAATRTITLGTPGTLSGSTTNSVTTSSHTHALSANLSAWDAITPASKANASHTHTIGDVTGLQTALDGKQAAGSYAAASHSHIISDVTGLQTALDAKLASANFTFANLGGKPTTVAGYGITDAATTARTITAGNGLSGGGTLGANRTITLGTPGSINATSTNAVQTAGHTHALDPLPISHIVNLQAELDGKLSSSSPLDATKLAGEIPANVTYGAGTAALPSMSFTTDPDSGIFSAGANIVGFAAGGVARVYVGTGGIYGVNSAAFYLLNEAASATNPTVAPRRSDMATGLGSAATGALNLIANSVNVVEATSTGLDLNVPTTVHSTRHDVSAMAANAIDFNIENLQTKTVSANTAFTFSNLAAGRWALVAVTVSGSRTITWPTNAKFPGGTAPTPTANGKDYYTLFSEDGVNVVVQQTKDVK